MGISVTWKMFMECFAPGTVSSLARKSCAILLPRLSAVESPEVIGVESDPWQAVAKRVIATRPYSLHHAI